MFLIGRLTATSTPMLCGALRSTVARWLHLETPPTAWSYSRPECHLQCIIVTPCVFIFETKCPITYIQVRVCLRHKRPGDISLRSVRCQKGCGRRGSRARLPSPTRLESRLLSRCIVHLLSRFPLPVPPRQVIPRTKAMHAGTNTQCSLARLASRRRALSSSPSISKGSRYCEESGSESAIRCISSA